MARLIDADALDAHSLPMDMGGCLLIDDVTEMIANAPTIEPVKQGWISVNDRMPERNELVLVCAANAARGGKIRFVGAYDGFWFLQTAADTIGLTIQYDVTHWMPLPEPPKNAQERVR